MLRTLVRKALPNYFRFAKPKRTVEPVPAQKEAPLEPKNTAKKDLSAEEKPPQAFMPSLYEFLLNGGRLEDVADMTKMKKPYHISHWDPKSPNYIHCEENEEGLHLDVTRHNKIIDDFENDLRLQAYINQIWQHEMEKPLKGVRGINKNVYDQVADYDFKNQQDNWTPTDSERAILAQLSNEKIINRSLFIPKMPKASHLEDWEAELENRPVNPHYHHGKGNKFDVETPESEKIPHLTDRLGHPEILPNPFETLLMLENKLTHPGFQDLAFVQMPPAEPDPSVNFNPGEVIYYKPNNIDWQRFWMFNTYSSLVLGCLFFPYLTIFKSTAPLPSIADEGVGPMVSISPYNFDYYLISPATVIAVVYAAVFYTSRVLNYSTSAYVSKVQYNELKDLIFVETTNESGLKEERVYEIDNLEILPPSFKSSTRFLDNSEKGMTTITCLNTEDELILHNDRKYWASNSRRQLFDKLTRLWDKSYYEQTY